MEIFKIEKDIRLLTIKARSFPDTIKEAFDLLEKNVPYTDKRIFFGLSKPEGGKIVYRAAITAEPEEEADQYKLEEFTLKQGIYLTEKINNWMNAPQQIGPVFEKLLQDSRLDLSSYCVEWYQGNDVLCMVKIKE
jgi:hypothetical protein